MTKRMSELHRRNTLQPPHMRSAYPAEMNDERLRRCEAACSSTEASPLESTPESAVLEKRMSAMNMESTPPRSMARKRRSFEFSELETPVKSANMDGTYRRFSNGSDISADSRASCGSSAERRKRREPSQTSYQRPGPPTPGRNSTKENISSTALVLMDLFFHLTFTSLV